MSTPLNVNSIVDSATILRGIQIVSNWHFYGTYPGELISLLDNVFTYEFNVATATAPAWAFLDRLDEVDVFIAGTPGSTSAANQFAATLLPMTSSGGLNSGAVQLNDASTIGTRLLQQIVGRRPRMGFYGHSYGGSLAAILAAQFTRLGVSSAVSALSAGAPRPGDGTIGAALQGVPFIRLMVAEDAVPFFIPHFPEAVTANIAAGPTLMILWWKWAQPGGGIVLYMDGSFEARALPSRVLPIADVDLVAWVTGASGEKANAHLLATYRTRVGQVLASGATKWSTGAVVGLAEVVPNVQPADAAALIAGGGQAVLNSLLGGSAVSVYVPPPDRPKVKLGINDYYVYWNGQVVSHHKTKSNAKTHAKYIFKWLRVMQTSASVSQNGLLNAITNYLALASQQGGLFIPVLNVTP